LRRRHAALQEEHEDQERVTRWEETNALSCFHHGKGEGGHKTKTLKHHQSCSTKDAAVKTLKALWDQPGKGEKREE